MRKLPNRLQAVYDLVPKGFPMADIGTDHAFLPIALVKENKVPAAFALDVQKGPLLIAKDHIEEAGLSDRIKARLSDGFTALSEGEAETAVITGMGGKTIKKILEERDPRTLGIKTLILGPQSEEALLRVFLQENGYLVSDERYLEEEGKLYALLLVQSGHEPPLSETEARFGRAALNHRDPVLLHYLEKKEKVIRGIMKGLPGNEAGQARKEELQKELSYVTEGKEMLIH